MKLHLPTPLRAAVLSCMVAAATLGTGTFASGVLIATLAISGHTLGSTTEPTGDASGNVNLNGNNDVTISKNTDGTYSISYATGTATEASKSVSANADGALSVNCSLIGSLGTDSSMSLSVTSGTYAQLSFDRVADGSDQSLGAEGAAKNLYLSVGGTASVSAFSSDQQGLFGWTQSSSKTFYANLDIDVNTTGNVAGLILTGETNASAQADGTSAMTLYGNIDVEILSGHFGTVGGASNAVSLAAGNKGTAVIGSATYNLGSLSGNAQPSFEGDIVGGIAQAGGGNHRGCFTGDIVVNVYGGTYKSIYATGVRATLNGNYTVNYYGGTIAEGSKIAVSQGGAVNGTSTLNIQSGASLLSSRVDVGSFNLLDVSRGGTLSIDSTVTADDLSKVMNHGTISLEAGGAFNLSTFKILDEEISSDKSSVTATFLLFDSDNGMGQYEGFSSSDGYTVDEQNHTVTFQQTVQRGDWDINWGAGGLVHQPSVCPNFLDNYTSLPEAEENASYGCAIQALTSSGSSFVSGSTTSATLSGEINGIYSDLKTIIVGGSRNPSSATTGDTWIRIEGSDTKVAIVVGGNYANGSSANFNGNSHIYMENGEVDNLVGGNYRDYGGTVFTGSSYISVLDGKVNGYIVGAGTTSHGRTNSFVGSSNIWIYTPLVNSETNVNLDWAGGANSSQGAVVGGGVACRNANTNKISFTGDTNVTVDLSNYTPDPAGGETFGKYIIGGSYLSTGASLTHSGETNITITGKDGVTFSKGIIGGSRLSVSGASSTHTGSINVTVKSGTFGADAYILGGTYDAPGGASVTTDGINLNLEGGTFNGAIVGGHGITGNDGTDLALMSTGDINITLGSKAVANNLILGGSATYRGSGTNISNPSEWKQGDINITLIGDSQINGNIYAAGGFYVMPGATAAGSGSSNAKLVTESTRVAIDSGVSFGETADASITISGGYFNLGNSTVTGARTLALTGEGANLESVLTSNVTLADFDTIEITQATGAAQLTQAMVDAGIRTKTGAGTLSVSGERETLTLNVAEGTLAVESSTTLSGLTFAAGSTLSLADRGLLIVQDTLDCTQGITLDLSDFVLTGAENGILLATIGNLVGSVDDITLTGLGNTAQSTLIYDSATHQLTLDVVLNQIVWTDPEQTGIWQDGKPFGEDGKEYENESSVSVIFGPLADGSTSETITISGPVTAGSLYIDPGTGKTYIYTPDAGDNNAITQVGTIRVASGTAHFAAGALDLASETDVDVLSGAELVLEDNCGGAPLNITLEAATDTAAGAILTWQGAAGSTATLSGTLAAGSGSQLIVQSGSLALTGQGNTLDGASIASGAALRLGSDTTLTGRAEGLELSGDTDTAAITLAAGCTLTLADGASLGSVTMAGETGSILSIARQAAVSVSGSFGSSGMLLEILSGATLTIGEQTSLMSTAGTNRAVTSGEQSYTGLTGSGALATAGTPASITLDLAQDSSYTYSGSLRDYTGTITITGSGTQTITSDAPTATLAVDGASLDLGSGSRTLGSLLLNRGGQATAALAGSSGNNNTLTVKENLTLGADSTLQLSLYITRDMLSSGDTTGAAVVQAGSVSYEGGGVDLDVQGVDSGLDLTGGDQVSLLILSGDSSTGTEVSLKSSGEGLLYKYFTDGVRLEKQGNNIVLTGTTVDGDTAAFYKVKATSANGRVGGAMLDRLYGTLNPEVNDPDSAAAAVLDELEQMILAGNSGAADRQMAAVSGASAAAMGIALAGDMQRQLTAIRNRTTTMGVGDAVINPDMPYFNAWINAEGNYRTMEQDGTLPGYELSSWGATVGVDADITPKFTAGLALTAMYGDFTAKAADTADGHLDTYYVTAFARYAPSAWVHTFVASVGLTDASLDRTVSAGDGVSRTSGDTDGFGIGLLYEVGYTIPMNEEGSIALQPIANITYVHSSLSGYSETGSDLAVHYGDQTVDVLTLGIGLRAQAVIGESIYNRSSLLEGRVLAKFDLGDRSSSASAGLAALGRASGELESAEIGAVGLEVGAGLTIPVGQDSGSLFLDGSLELRADYTNVNATVGYRVNF